MKNVIIQPEKQEKTVNFIQGLKKSKFPGICLTQALKGRYNRYHENKPFIRGIEKSPFAILLAWEHYFEQVEFKKA
jgi:hypothetical protein